MFIKENCNLPSQEEIDKIRPLVRSSHGRSATDLEVIRHIMRTEPTVTVSLPRNYLSVLLSALDVYCPEPWEEGARTEMIQHLMHFVVNGDDE